MGIRKKHRMVRAGGLEGWGNDLRAAAEAQFTPGQKSAGFPTHCSRAQPRALHTLHFQPVSKIAVSVSPGP